MNLHIPLFSQVAYSYIPVDLYPQSINQQNVILWVTVYAPASPYGSLGCRAYLGSAGFRFEYLPHPAVGDAKKVGNIAVVVPTIR